MATSSPNAPHLLSIKGRAERDARQSRRKNEDVAMMETSTPNRGKSRSSLSQRALDGHPRNRVGTVSFTGSSFFGLYRSYL